MSDLKIFLRPEKGKRRNSIPDLVAREKSAVGTFYKQYSILNFQGELYVF